MNKDKSKGASYRKNRDKWIFAQSTVIIVLTLAVLICSLVSSRLDKKSTVTYTEGGSVNYNVFLKNNEFFEKDHLTSGNTYVASLIDTVVTTFSYHINMEQKDVDYRYSYRILSTLEILEASTNGMIFEKTQELVSKEDLTHNSNTGLTISEIVAINYDSYNALASNFLDAYDLEHTNSRIVLSLEVDVESQCASFLSTNTDNYVSELHIPLTTKTVNVAMTSNVPTNEDRSVACRSGVGSEAFRTTAIVLGVVDALLIPLLVAFILLTRTKDMTYVARVKRLTSQYKSFIQKTKNEFDAAGYQVLHVERFDELLEIRETVSAPILMFSNETELYTRFYVPTTAKLLYVYEMKVEGCESAKCDPRPADCPCAAHAPCTHFAPACEVEQPPVAPTADVADAPLADVTPVALPTEEEQAFLLDSNKCVWLTDEEADALGEELTEKLMEETTVANGVDAIDVILGDHNETFDPDGNLVECGDVVSVADNDAAIEAEVVKGNYRVDPTTLDKPLTKILAVVRRKAEQVFTAMITPVEEDDQNK